MQTPQTQTLTDPPVRQGRPAAAPAPGGHPMEIWISTVLRGGVLTAGAIIALGLALFLIQGPGPGDPASLAALRAQGSRSLAVHLSAIVGDALHGRATAVIQVGVLALIATPLCRVAMTIGLFLALRDRVFVLITTAVFAVLILGLVGVGA